jgi:type III secretory pathway component EscV
MGKKELVEELDRQLAKAQKTKRLLIFAWITITLFLFIGFVFPLLWFLALLLIIFAIVDYYSANKKIEKINLEKAKLK